MELKKFEKGFQQEEQELLVLIQHDISGGIVVGDYVQPSAAFLASIDVKTGEFSDRKGRLEWMVKRKKGKTDWGFPLKGMEIYHVRVRKSFPIEIKENMRPEMNNRYLLLKILKNKVSNKELEQIRTAYMTPVEINDEKLGRFVLERDLEWYEGEIDWLGKDCNVMLELDGEEAETADKAMEVLHRLMDDLEQWDEKIRTFAAEGMVESANEWQDEEENSPITKEEFMKRMEICSLNISADGEMTIAYMDDDMFWGHSIVIYGNISGELNDASIEG